VSPAGEQLREKLRNAEAREEAIRDAIVSEHAELRRTLQQQALRMGVDARAASTGVAVDAAAASVEESAAALVVAAEGVDSSGASVAAAEATMIQAAEGVEESAAALVAAEGVEESAEATTIQAAEGVDSSAASVATAEATTIQAAEGVEESAEATTIQAAEGVDSSAASVAAAEATTIQAAAARAAAAQLRAAIDAAHAEIEDTNAEILAISARTEVSTLTTAIKAARAEIDAQAARALQSEKTIRSLQAAFAGAQADAQAHRATAAKLAADAASSAALVAELRDAAQSEHPSAPRAASNEGVLKAAAAAHLPAASALVAAPGAALGVEKRTRTTKKKRRSIVEVVAGTIKSAVAAVEERTAREKAADRVKIEHELRAKLLKRNDSMNDGLASKKKRTSAAAAHLPAASALVAAPEAALGVAPVASRRRTSMERRTSMTESLRLNARRSSAAHPLEGSELDAWLDASPGPQFEPEALSFVTVKIAAEGSLGLAFDIEPTSCMVSVAEAPRAAGAIRREFPGTVREGDVLVSANGNVFCPLQAFDINADGRIDYDELLMAMGACADPEIARPRPPPPPPPSRPHNFFDRLVHACAPLRARPATHDGGARHERSARGVPRQRAAGPRTNAAHGRGGGVGDSPALRRRWLR
jgi:hypothetical protein